MATINTYSKRFFPDRNTDYAPQEVIHINIPPDQCVLLNGKDSYLRCTVRLNCALLAKLDPFAGGHALFDYIQIYSGDGSALLEELRQNASWHGIRMYYDDCEGLRNKRQLLEGKDGDTVRQSIRNGYSMYYDNPVGTALVTPQSFRDVELCIPLYNSGVLYGDRAFPVIATQGIQLRLYLSSAEQAITFPNVPGLVTKRDRTPGLPALTDLANDLSTAVLGPAPQDNLNGPIGRCFALRTALAAGATTQVDVMLETTASIVPAQPTAGLAVNVKATASSTTAPLYCGITPGMHLAYVNGAGAVQDCGLITGVAFSAPDILRFTVSSFAATVAAAGVSVFAYIPQANSAVDFKVSNVEFFASCVEPDEGFYAEMERGLKAEGGMNFDIMSFNVTRNNLQASNTVQDELIALTARRARALMQFTFAPIPSPFRSYFRPVADYLRSYQHIIHDMRVPQLAVDTDREFQLGETGFNPLCDDERHKLLTSSKIDVKNETEPANCFVMGRRLAMRGHSFDANADSLRTTVTYGIQDGANLVTAQENKLLVTYCRHFRRIVCTPTVVRVEY